MKIRRATENDFAEYVRLYNDSDAETIYRGNDDDKINPQKQQEAVKYFGLDDPDSDWMKQLEEYDRRTPEKFLADITSPNNRIIMIQNSYRVVGFIELYLIKRFVWKIAFICIEQRYQTPKVMSELMQYLFKKEKMRQLDVCTLGGKFDKVLESVGFVHTSPLFLHKTLDG